MGLRLRNDAILMKAESVRQTHAPVGTDHRLMTVQNIIHGEKPIQKFMASNYGSGGRESRIVMMPESLLGGVTRKDDL